MGAGRIDDIFLIDVQWRVISYKKVLYPVIPSIKAMHYFFIMRYGLLKQKNAEKI